MKWENTLALARREGKVSVYNTAGPRIREALIPAFQDKFGIELELTITSPGAAAAKVLAERNAGLYVLDVFHTGPVPLLTPLKPAGALDPIGPALILPEVLDKAAWLGGDLNYIDDERRYLIAFTGNPSSKNILLINRELAKKDELISYFDLLQAKWKGKIVMMDPTVPGKAANWFHMMLFNKRLDQEYMRALAKQEAMLTRDERQMAEWVVRGKKAIGMLGTTEINREFIKMGANVEEKGRFYPEPKNGYPDGPS